MYIIVTSIHNTWKLQFIYFVEIYDFHFNFGFVQTLCILQDTFELKDLLENSCQEFCQVMKTGMD